MSEHRRPEKGHERVRGGPWLPAAGWSRRRARFRWGWLSPGIVFCLAGLCALGVSCGGGTGEPVCGNGRLEGQELCDDGTLQGSFTDGPCSSECLWKEYGPSAAGSAMYPSVAMNSRGDFVLAWRGADSSDDEDIFAAAYAASGALLVPPFQVNQRSTGNQQYPSAAMDDQGRFLVAWQTDPQSTGAEDGNVWVRAFEATGAPLSGDLQLNTWTEGRQSRPSLAVNGQGILVAAWTSAGQDGDLTGVYARMGDSSGNLSQGEPQRVNTEIVNSQENPSVAIAPSGLFVIAWESRGQEST